MSPVLQLDVRDTMAAPARALSPVVHTGREAVAARSREMEELARRCGQAGAMHGLRFLLEQEYTGRKIPHLVCFHALRGELTGAVLLFEHRVAGWPTGLMATGDRFGVRTVIGVNALRPWLAREACAAMLRRGAKAVLVSFKWAGRVRAADFAADVEPRWAMQTRTVRDTLPLAPSLDATFALLGKRTRTHLRYYRRRVEKAFSCAYVPDAASSFDLNDGSLLTRLNRDSLDPVAQCVFDLQFRMAAILPGGFIGGLRADDGKWLALVGGWRQAGTTWIQWQTNASGYQDVSLGTALRSFLIEDEVVRGTARLAFHGGTSHSMSHAFQEDQVVDMVAIRQGGRAGRLTRLVPWLYSRLPSLTSRGNLLGDVLASGRLRWFEEEELAGAFDSVSGGEL